MKVKFLVLALVICAPSMAADVAVSVTIGDPGFFGRVDIDSYPRPRLILPTPVVIHAYHAGTVRAPLYLRVPPGHEKHWDKHCAKYDACGRPVYFIEDDWYNTVYVPAYREKHGRPDHPGKGQDKEKKHKGNGPG